MKIITILAIISLFLSCKNKMENSTSSSKRSAGSEVENEKPDLTQPSLFMGTDFGSYIQSLYKLGMIAEIYKFLSENDKKEFSQEEFANLISSNNLAYKLTIKRVEKRGGFQYTLHYTSSEIATTKVRKLDALVENDTLRIQLSRRDGNIEVFY